MRIPFISLAAASALALGGCAYGGLGLGYGYGDYGYGSYGGYYGSPYYGLGYGNPYYSYGRYGGLFGSPYYGWYDNFYYPGSGYYVYDIYRRPHVWTSSQRNYWVSRRPTVTTSSTKTTVVRPNWSGFNRDRTVRTRAVAIDRPSRSERLQQIQERRSQRLSTKSSRQRVRTTSQDD